MDRVRLNAQLGLCRHLCLRGLADRGGFLSSLLPPSGIRWLSISSAFARVLRWSRMCPVAPARAFPPLLIWLALRTSPSPFPLQGPSQLSWMECLDVRSLSVSWERPRCSCVWALPVVSLLHSPHPLRIRPHAVGQPQRYLLLSRD